MTNQLYDLVLAGDTEAEEQLFRALSARFRLFARQRVWDSAEAEEVVQEALLRVYEEYRNVVIRSSFSAWAYKVLDNRVLAHIQRQKRAKARAERDLPAVIRAVSSGQPTDPELKRQLLDCLRQVAAANTRYARALNFSYQGYATDDICRRLDLTRSNLYSVLHRARTMLIMCLAKGEVD